MDSAMDCKKNQYVGLNVGGVIYRTSRATLTRYPQSFFAAMLGGDMNPSATDEQGNFLIDRDGAIFRHVLNFLRCGELVLPEGFREFELLEREADFFSLEELKNKLYGTETIGIVDKSSSTVYKMSRQALMREKDSYFAKIVRGQMNPLKDSNGNILVDSTGSKDEFMEILQYLKHGVVSSELEYSFPWKENTLYKMADCFGLEILKDQVKETMLNRSLLEVYWQKGPECSLYFKESQLSLREICQEYSLIFKTPDLSFKRYAGIVNLRHILQDAPDTQESLKTFFSKKLDIEHEATCFEEELISAPYCIKLSFH